MYGMLYGTVWPYLQHEKMVWYGAIASLPGTLMLDSVLSLIACVLIKYLVKDFERKRQLTA